MVGKRISGMKKRKKCVWAMMISLIVGMSALTGCQEDAEQWQISVSEEFGAPTFYGVIDSDLAVSDVVWKVLWSGEKATSKLTEGIELKKQGGDIFCFELTNESQKDWSYHPVLPAVELWYDGVWIEVKSPCAETAMNSCIRASETVTVHKADKEVDYPYLFPGLYRLVYYGKDGDCVISDVFEVR